MTGGLHPRRSADGWVATTVGGSLGGIGLGAVAFVLVTAYYDGRLDTGLEALGWMLVWTAAGISGGLASGAAVALRVRGYTRQASSGLVFSTIASLTFIGWGVLGGRVLAQWDEGVILVLALVTVIPGSAWVTRWLLAPRGPREHLEG